jgi:hypothetical protein
MVTAKRSSATKKPSTPATHTFKVVLCYQIQSVPRNSSHIASQSEEFWRRHNSTSGLHAISAKPWAYARKEVRLPFVPFPGLRLHVPHVDSGIPIVLVAWHVDRVNQKSEEDLSSGHFLCTYEDAYPKGAVTYERLREHAVQSGWEVSEFGSD